MIKFSPFHFYFLVHTHGIVEPVGAAVMVTFTAGPKPGKRRRVHG